MADLPASALAPPPFSRALVAGVAGVLLVAALDALLADELALVGVLAVVALVVALTARPGDAIVVAALGVVVGVASGAWNGWDAAWGYGLGALVACMALAVLVGLLRASAMTTERRLRMLRDLAVLVHEPAGMEAIVDRLFDVLVPAFADAAGLELGGQRLGVRGEEPGDAAPERGLVFPLVARGAPFGALSLALGRSRRRYSAADRAFGDLVGSRVAIVLDNAGLTRQAAEAEQRMVAALDALGEAVTMNGPDGRTVYANQAAVELLKARSAEELTGGEVGEISARFAMFDEHGTPMEIADFPAFKALRGEDRPAPVLIRSVVRATGEERWLVNKVTVLRGNDGSVDRVVNVVDDVSEVKRAELAQRVLTDDLQRGLRPPRLPHIPGFDVATLYRPAGELNEVGGDFYDAFPTPGGWMVLIGDVAGQGARAAALTGLARFTLRSVGQVTGDPVRAAQQLNATLRDQSELSLCTAVCLLLASDGDGLTATTVSCGHPLPVLVRGGTAVSIGVPGTLAGAFDDGSWSAETVSLEPGDALVLYTDGVFDTVGRAGRLGEERLIALLAGSPSGAGAVVAHVDAALRAFQSGAQADDTALVVLSVTRD